MNNTGLDISFLQNLMEDTPTFENKKSKVGAHTFKIEGFAYPKDKEGKDRPLSSIIDVTNEYNTAVKFVDEEGNEIIEYLKPNKLKWKQSILARAIYGDRYDSVKAQIGQEIVTAMQNGQITTPEQQFQYFLTKLLFGQSFEGYVFEKKYTKKATPDPASGVLVPGEETSATTLAYFNDDIKSIPGAFLPRAISTGATIVGQEVQNPQSVVQQPAPQVQTVQPAPAAPVANVQQPTQVTNGPVQPVAQAVTPNMNQPASQPVATPSTDLPNPNQDFEWGSGDF